MENHQKFLETALPFLQSDTRIRGIVQARVAPASDFELILVSDADGLPGLKNEAGRIAERMGRLLVSFRDQNARICLYEEPLIGLRLRFVSAMELEEESAGEVLWERDGSLSRMRAAPAKDFPSLDLQWMEDRFWVWVHSAALKLSRGELFGSLEILGLLHSRILGPLLKEMKGGTEPSSQSTLEAATIRQSVQSLKAAARHYLELREMLAPENLRRHRRAEMAAMRFLHEAMIPHEVSRTERE